MKEFKPTEWVALEGHPDEWVSHSELENLEKKNVTEFPKSAGEAVVSVNVSKLLNEADVLDAQNRRLIRTFGDRPLKLFISYAHEDEKWRLRLKPNLELLQREELIEIWSDRQIVPGSKWDEEIQCKLNEAELYLFLMSTHLLNSDYVRKHELPAALNRYKEKKAGFVPIVVQRCSWKKYVGEIQGLPSGGRPVSDWKPHDRACFDVEEGLRKTIAEVWKLVRSY